MKTKWRVRYDRDGYFYVEKEKSHAFGLFPYWEYVTLTGEKETAIEAIQKLKNPIVYEETA
jgi:hypothetical protein